MSEPGRNGETAESAATEVGADLTDDDLYQILLRIREFWRWWETICDELDAAVAEYRSERMFPELEKRVKQVHQDLEVGVQPGITAHCALALLTRTELGAALVQAMLEDAPEPTEKWEYTNIPAPVADLNQIVHRHDDIEITMRDLRAVTAEYPDEKAVLIGLWHPRFADMFARYGDDVGHDLVQDIATIALTNPEPGGYQLRWKILKYEPSEDLGPIDINAIRAYGWELEERTT